MSIKIFPFVALEWSTLHFIFLAYIGMDVGGKGWGWGGGGGGIRGASLGTSNGMRHTGHKQVIVYKMLMPIFVIGTKGLSYVNINFFCK